MRRTAGFLFALVVLATAALMPVTPARASWAPVVITYSVQAKGSFPSSLAGFAAGVAQTFTDERGWSLGGSIEFRQVAAGTGEFRLWLAADALVPSFGGPCTTFYSCQPGRDVVINEARWRTGSPYWAGSVADYRHLVVNHEVGHWLGFRGHPACPAPGAPAPVMMQQSKELGGCLPNPWPTGAEQRALAARRGVPVLPSRAVALARTPRGGGYWVLRPEGEVRPFGTAAHHGSTIGAPAAIPTRSLASTPTGRGYWVLDSAGGVFTFGDATFHGSAYPLAIVRPAVALVPTPTGRGYWMLDSAGGVFSFGDATFHGSIPGLRNAGVTIGPARAVAMAPTPTGRGYWMLDSAGGVFTFGDARFWGSAA